MLDSSTDRYSGLTWRDGAPDIAVLRSLPDSAYRDTAHIVIAWTGVNTAAAVRHELRPMRTAEFPADMRVSDTRAPQWSPDGTIVTVGLRPVRLENGWLGWERTFRFDYSRDGEDRHAGRLVLRGGRLLSLTGPLATVDLTGVDALDELRRTLADRGIVFAMARVKWELRSDLQRIGLVERIGEDRLFPTLPTAVAAFRRWQDGDQ